MTPDQMTETEATQALKDLLTGLDTTEKLKEALPQIKDLLRQGADPNVQMKDKDSNEIAAWQLISIADSDLMQMMEGKVDWDTVIYPTNNRFSLAHNAAYSNNRAALEFLAKRGVDLYKKDQIGNRAIDHITDEKLREDIEKMIPATGEEKKEETVVPPVAEKTEPKSVPNSQDNLIFADPDSEALEGTSYEQAIEGTATSADSEEENLEEGTATSADSEEENLDEATNPSPEKIYATEPAPGPTPIYKAKEGEKDGGKGGVSTGKRVKDAFEQSWGKLYKTVFETSYKAPEDFADAFMFAVLTFPLDTLEAYLSKTYSSTEKDYLKEILKELQKDKQNPQKEGADSEKLALSPQEKAFAGLAALLQQGNKEEIEKMYAALGKRDGITPDEVKDFLNKNPEIYKKFKSSMNVIASHPFGRKLLRDAFPSHTGEFTHDDLIRVFTGANRVDQKTNKDHNPSVPEKTETNGGEAYLESVNNRLLSILEAAQKQQAAPVNINLSNIGNPKVDAKGGAAKVSDAGNARGGNANINDSGNSGKDDSVRVSNSGNTENVDAEVEIGDKTTKTVTEKRKDVIAPVAKTPSKNTNKPEKTPTPAIKPKQAPDSQAKRVKEITTSFYAKIDSLKIKDGEKEVRKDMFIQLLSKNKKQMGRFEQAILLQQERRRELKEIKLKKGDQEINKNYLKKAQAIDKDLKKVYLGIRLNNLLMTGSSAGAPNKKKENTPQKRAEKTQEKTNPTNKKPVQGKKAQPNNIAQKIYNTNVGDSYN